MRLIPDVTCSFIHLFLWTINTDRALRAPVKNAKPGNLLALDTGTQVKVGRKT